MPKEKVYTKNEQWLLTKYTKQTVSSKLGMKNHRDNCIQICSGGTSKRTCHLWSGYTSHCIVQVENDKKCIVRCLWLRHTINFIISHYKVCTDTRFCTSTYLIIYAHM